MQVGLLALFTVTPNSMFMLGPMYKKYALRAGLATFKNAFFTMAFRGIMGLSMMAAIKEGLKRNKLAMNIYDKFLQPKTTTSKTEKYVRSGFLFMIELGIIMMFQSAVGHVLI